MAKTSKKQPQSARTNIVIWESYNLQTKFQEKALVPQEAIDRNWLGIWCYNAEDHKLKESAVFVTTDSYRVRIKLIGCINNSRGDEHELLSHLSNKIYGLKFEIIQSHWFARFGNLSGYWHIIEMEEAK